MYPVQYLRVKPADLRLVHCWVHILVNTKETTLNVLYHDVLLQTWMSHLFLRLKKCNYNSSQPNRWGDSQTMWIPPCCKLIQGSPSVVSQTSPAKPSEYRVSNVEIWRQSKMGDITQRCLQHWLGGVWVQFCCTGSPKIWQSQGLLCNRCPCVVIWSVICWNSYFPYKH